MTRPTAQGLIAQASELLSAQGSVHRPSLIRSASWLARSALEDLVTSILRARGYEPGKASMRSRLTCLEAADQELAETAEFVWSALSRACHHHAFELAPTPGEIRHLVSVVDALARRTIGPAIAPVDQNLAP